MNTPFIINDAALLCTQAALVALPGRGVPPALARFRGPGWALVLPLSIAVVVGAIAAFPEVARGLSWLALLAIPPLAAAALGWAMHGASPPLALLAAPLLALGWAAQDSLAGDVALAALTALSCVTLGRLLAGLVPLAALELGIVAMAVVDAILVFGNQLQGPNQVLNTAVPAAGLPQLQYLSLPHASLGYGDVFVAGVLGGVLAARGERQWPVALLVLALSAAWDLLFFVFDTLPATVPVAIATLVCAVTRRRGRPRAVSRSATDGKQEGNDSRIRDFFTMRSDQLPRHRRRLVALLAVAACAMPLGVAGASDAPTGRPQDNFAVAQVATDGQEAWDFEWSLERQRGGTVDNENHAIATTNCASCQAVAIAFQVVLVSGSPDKVVPQNIAEATNEGSDTAISFADARQFVWVTDKPVRFTKHGRRELADIRNDIRALETTPLTVAQLRTKLDEERARVNTVLHEDLVTVRDGKDNFRRTDRDDTSVDDQG